MVLPLRDCLLDELTMLCSLDRFVAYYPIELCIAVDDVVTVVTSYIAII